MTNADLARLIDRLDLAPHPEGGFYREVYRSAELVQRGDGARRPAGTAILYLLERGEVSLFHRVRHADEVWHLYDGGDLELHRLDPVSGTHDLARLSLDVARGDRVATVAADVWQAARVTGPASFALCGCTVSPGFDFEDFELADGQALAARHPDAAGLIRAMTRSRVTA